MFQSTWISIVGLALEIFGLSFLFYDLLVSKQLAVRDTAFAKAQDELEVSTRQLTILTTQGTRTLAEAFKSFAALMAQSMDDLRNKPDLERLRQEDAEKAKIVEFIRTRLETHIAAGMVDAINKLPSEKAIAEAIALNATAQAELGRSYAAGLHETRRLKRVARIGVGCVGVGALFQLFDLLF